MKSFQRSISELQEFIVKNQVGRAPRLSIIFESERDKAYFIQGLRAELQPEEIQIHTLKDVDFNDFTIRGIHVRLLA